MKNFTRILLLLVTIVFNHNVFAQSDYSGYSNNLVSVDFDNNGIVDDLVGINSISSDNTLTLWKNNNNTFSETRISIPIPENLIDMERIKGKLVSGDFDNDGFIDDIAAIYEIGLNKTSITVWTNQKGKLTASQWWYGGDFDANQISKTLVSGDFDNDGFIDDIAAFYDYQNDKTKVFVWKSDSQKFNWPGTWWIGNDFNSANIQGKMLVGDFDHDGFVDDIAALYDYADEYCKIFVWPSTGNGFTWPQTWYQQANFNAININGNVIAGDFNKNGFIDNIAAFYKNNEQQSEVLVWEKYDNKFNAPTTWWYGNDEAVATNNRLVAFDSDGNGVVDQFTGLYLKESIATLTTWTANNNQFETPEEKWKGIALSNLSCEKDGSCLPNSQNKEFSVYPNPAHDSFTISIPDIDDTDTYAYIYSSLGNIVYQSKVEGGTLLNIDLKDLNTGNYFIHVQSNKLNYREKLIIE